MKLELSPYEVARLVDKLVEHARRALPDPPITQPATPDPRVQFHNTHLKGDIVWAVDRLERALELLEQLHADLPPEGPQPSRETLRAVATWLEPKDKP